MAYSVFYDPARDFVESVLSGLVFGRTIYLAADEMLALSRKHFCTKFFIDTSRQQSGPSLGELYRLPDFFNAQKLDCNSRAAVILPKFEAARDAPLFWETVCRNPG